MKRHELEKELEKTLNNLRDIKSNKLKAQCITDTLEHLGVFVATPTVMPVTKVALRKQIQ